MTIVRETREIIGKAGRKYSAGDEGDAENFGREGLTALG